MLLAAITDGSGGHFSSARSCCPAARDRAFAETVRRKLAISRSERIDLNSGALCEGHPLPLAAELQRSVPVILDPVAAPTRQQQGDQGPAIAEEGLLLQNDRIFLRRPVAGAEVALEVVIVAVPTLLSGPPGE